MKQVWIEQYFLIFVFFSDIDTQGEKIKTIFLTNV